MADTIKRIVDVINIESDEKYYDTPSAILKLQKTYFVDSGAPSFVSGSVDSKSVVAGLFARTANKASFAPNTHAYVTSSKLVDPFRSGVEITNDARWAAGSVKISAGTEGHIINDPLCFGISKTDSLVVTDDSSHSWFKEIDYFDPIRFINAQDPDILDYINLESIINFPIVTSDVRQRELYLFNGIIEALPIREVISFSSIRIPFEPRGILGSFGNGNYRRMHNSSDDVVTLYPREENRRNIDVFLDEGEALGLPTVEGEAAVFLGQSYGQFTTDTNKLSPFADISQARDQSDLSDYDGDLLAVVANMYLCGDTYVREKERSCTVGFVYDNSPYGTDSIAFGGLKY